MILFNDSVESEQMTFRPNSDIFCLGEISSALSSNKRAKNNKFDPLVTNINEQR